MGKDKNKSTVQLVKMFREYPEKVVYEGTLKGAKKRIPPSKKEQFRIDFLQS